MKSVQTAALALLAAGMLALSPGMAPAVTVNFTSGTGISGMGTSGTGTGALATPRGFDIGVKMTSNTNRQPDIDTVWGGVNPGAAVLVTGIWRYATHDRRGSAADPLGFFVGTAFTPLSALMTAPAGQKGTFAFLVPQGSSFGWLLGSTDGRHGRARAVIHANLTPAPIPLPATGLLLLAGLGGLMGLRRCRASQG